jgi:hypothetical protein
VIRRRRDAVRGKRIPVVVRPSVNDNKTWMVVKPVKKKGLLGIAIVSAPSPALSPRLTSRSRTVLGFMRCLAARPAPPRSARGFAVCAGATHDTRVAAAPKDRRRG